EGQSRRPGRPRCQLGIQERDLALPASSTGNDPHSTWPFFQPGCFSIAPLWPHSVERAHSRSLSEDASGPLPVTLQRELGLSECCFLAGRKWRACALPRADSGRGRKGEAPMTNCCAVVANR